MKNKDTLNSILKLVWKYGVGFVLLLIGTIYMIVASRRLEPPLFGDYPEFLMIGLTIMAFGILAFLSNDIKSMVVAKFNVRKERMRLRHKEIMAKLEYDRETKK